MASAAEPPRRSSGVPCTGKRAPLSAGPDVFELYKTSLLGGMAAGRTDAPKRGVVGRLPAVSSGQLDDVLANRRRVIALSDGDDTDF